MKFFLPHRSHIPPLSCFMSLRPRRSEKFYIGFNVIGDEAAPTNEIWFSIENEAPCVQKRSEEKTTRDNCGKSAGIAPLELGLSRGTISSIRCVLLQRLSAPVCSPFFQEPRSPPGYFLKRPLSAIDRLVLCFPLLPVHYRVPAAIQAKQRNSKTRFSKPRLHTLHSPKISADKVTRSDSRSDQVVRYFTFLKLLGNKDNDFARV